MATPVPPVAPGPDLANRARRRSRWQGLTALAVVIVFIVGGGSLLGPYIGLTMPWQALGPTADEVQGGNVATAERLAATKAVTGWVAANPSISGAKPVGTQVQSWCLMYSASSLHCEMDSFQFDAWSGDFDRVAKVARADMLARCGRPAAPAVRKTPDLYGETDMESFACPDGVQVDLTFSTPTDSIGYIMNKDCTDNPQRVCVAGPTTEEILKHLRGYDWVAIRAGHQTYYER